MKMRVLCVFFCFLLFSYYGKSEVQDSLDIIFIRSLANTDPQNAQRLLDSVWGKKDIPDYQLYWVQADIYKHTSQYMLSIKYENLLLAEDSVQNNYSYFINATRNLCDDYLAIDEYGKAIECAGLQLDKIKELNLDDRVKRWPYWTIGKAYIALGDKKQGYHFANEAISLFTKVADDMSGPPLRRTRALFELSECYNELTLDYCEDKSYEKAYQTALMHLDVINNFSDADKKRMPPRVLEMQQCHCYGNLAYVLSKMKQYDEAGKYFKILESNPCFDSVTGRELAVRYYQVLGNNEDIIRLLERNYQFYESLGDITSPFVETCRQLAEAYLNLHKYKEAVSFYQKTSVLSDTLYERDRRSKALEMATLYNIQEKESQIERQKVRIHQGDMIISSAVVTVVLCLVIIILIIGVVIQERRRNKKMYTQMNEYLKLKDKAQERIQQLEDLIRSQNEELKLDGNGSDNLFEQFVRLLKEEHLLQDPSLTRDYVVKRLFTNKNKFIAVLQAHTGMNFTNYINSLRLEMVVKQISEEVDCDMHVVASTCGFGSYRTMSRLFSARYGMSPVQYAKLNKEYKEQGDGLKEEK